MSVLVFITAIAISVVAAYYSIIGLITIFAASVIPVAVMGSVLEVAKLVTATWLYRNWKDVHFLMKTYLTTAVVVLMLITSMGIFGFLSKAHIEQTAKAEQSVAVIERIDEQIEGNLDRIEELKSQAIVNNTQQNDQLVQNTKQIEAINERYNVLIEEQNAYISEANSDLILLDKYIAENDIRRLQALVGAKVDGNFGSGTGRRVDAFRSAAQEASSGIVSEARSRIKELRDMQLSEVSTLTEANRRLQAEIGTVVVDTEQISQIEAQILTLNSDKFDLETDFRKLEAEFGPIRYISELIYDDAESKLDDAVRVVILMLIFVFDPLAVLLLIASNHGYQRKESTPDEPVHDLPINSDDDVPVKTKVEKVEVEKEKIIKGADVEVKYNKETAEFNFVETEPEGVVFRDDVIRDDRPYPELRAKKEQ
jgi:peptidoglycan hydrolase-like protein with peptidoglycan-binding domain